MAASEPSVSLLSREDNKWRKDLIFQLQERNKRQTYCFADLISLHNRLFESANTLRGENIQLTIANETLRREAASGTPGLSVNADLEARLLKQAEELATLHKRKGEHTQQIVDLNNKLQEMMKELQVKETSLAESIELNTNLRLEITKCLNKEKELESINQMLKDEHQALQLAFASLEEKLRKTQEENRQLIERLIKYKTRDAEKVNEENDNFLKKRQAKVQKELEDAARDTRPVSPDRSSLKEGIAGLPTAVPTKTAHDGEVYAVKWSPVERMLATGGADRKVKLWNISKGASESKGILVGSNAGVMCVDFDSTGTLILGASNDYASRVWTVSDFRLKVSGCLLCGNIAVYSMAVANGIQCVIYPYEGRSVYCSRIVGHVKCDYSSPSDRDCYIRGNAMGTIVVPFVQRHYFQALLSNYLAKLPHLHP
ncbi:Autophagy-related protein [Apis cerana cerana]|uniref:Autophagy-related protein n=1 Tax=Apis cerana cerana TaxID=94128 RepID=A0A2A3EPV7_APICC|nr:Autophagy-related protein [Apis cerana cerana]